MQVEQAGIGILPGTALDAATADALTANELACKGSEPHQSRAHSVCKGGAGSAGAGETAE